MTSSSRESRNTTRKECCFQFNCDGESYHSPCLASQQLSHCSRNPTFTRIDRQPCSAGVDAHQPQSRAWAIPSAACTPEQGTLPCGLQQIEQRLLSGPFTPAARREGPYCWVYGQCRILPASSEDGGPLISRRRWDTL